MNEDRIPFDAWPVETTDLTLRVAEAIRYEALREEVEELRATVALLRQEVARLQNAPSRRLTPFAGPEGRARLA